VHHSKGNISANENNSAKRTKEKGNYSAKCTIVKGNTPAKGNNLECTIEGE